jgi:hypothetical protein
VLSFQALSTPRIIASDEERVAMFSRAAEYIDLRRTRRPSPRSKLKKEPNQLGGTLGAEVAAQKSGGSAKGRLA